MKSHIQLVYPGGGLWAPLNVHTLVGYPGLQPAKSLHSMPPDVHLGMGSGTAQPLSVPCSMAMNFEPRLPASSETQGQMPSSTPVDCIQAIGSCDLAGIWMLKL